MEETAETIPVASPQKEKRCNNVILTSKEPVLPAAIVRGMYLYYSPADICQLALSLYPDVVRVALMLSGASPSFIMLLEGRGLREITRVVETQRRKPNAICSLDEIYWDFMHSFRCESVPVEKMIQAFLKGNYDDEHCAICLNQCTCEHQLFTFPCGHTLHTKCVARMSQWECPVCRYAPISSLDTACCKVCGSFDRPFVCLCCSDSFCNEHMRSHYRETGHAYCTSADRRETWNLMSGNSMRRITYDKSGEFVEMCAKDDQLRGYLEAAIDEQVEIHKSLAAQRVKKEAQKIEMSIQKLRDVLEEKRKAIADMRTFVAEGEKRKKKLDIARNILDHLKQRSVMAEQENEELKKEIKKLEEEVRSQTEFVRDIEGTLCLHAAGAMSPNDQVHVVLSPK